MAVHCSRVLMFSWQQVLDSHVFISFWRFDSFFFFGGPQGQNATQFPLGNTTINFGTQLACPTINFKAQQAFVKLIGDFENTKIQFETLQTSLKHNYQLLTLGRTRF